MFIFFFFVFDEEANTTVPVEADIENDEELEFFFDDKVRKVWHKQQEEWYFSIVDVCQVLTDSADGRKYWNKLKQRLLEEGNESVTNCHQLKMKSRKDGKMYKTDAVTIEQLLRIIQSIPSKRAEPFKLWLAQVGRECLEEIADPELAYERMIRTYRQKGYSERWINRRLETIDQRKKLTATWDDAGVKSGKEYASLTDTLTYEWSGKHVKEYKSFKRLHKESLRDNMTDAELALNQLAELSATLIAQTQKPKGYSETKRSVIDGGSIAGNARRELEAKLGRSVISPFNASTPELLDDNED